MNKDILYKNLVIKDIPKHNYQLTGKKYIELTTYSKECQKEIEKRYNKKENLLFVDYFFWDCLKNSEEDKIEEEKTNGTVLNNRYYHNEFVDYIKNIGRYLDIIQMLKDL